MNRHDRQALLVSSSEPEYFDRRTSQNMTTGSTLHSRLRILVAKAYRAEKLYASLRNNANRDSSMVVDIANDVRAKEWKKAYSQLRTALNELFEITTPAHLPARVGSVLLRFQKASKEASVTLEKEVQGFVEAARRREFARTLKQSLELIRLKARAQAGKVIVDELNAVLQLNAREMPAVRGKGVRLTAARNDDGRETLEGESGGAAGNGTESSNNNDLGEVAPELRANSNVIPLRRARRR